MKLMNTALLVSAFTVLAGCGPKESNITASSSAEDVYAESCAGCHSGGLKGWLTGAPEVGDKEVWQPIIAKGIEPMTAITIAGAGKMPAKGGCDKCSEDQIKAAVELMANQSK